MNKCDELRAVSAFHPTYPPKKEDIVAIFDFILAFIKFFISERRCFYFTLSYIFFSFDL